MAKGIKFTANQVTGSPKNVKSGSGGTYGGLSAFGGPTIKGVGKKRGFGIVGGPQLEYSDKSVGTGGYALTDRAVPQRSMGGRSRKK